MKSRIFLTIIAFGSILASCSSSKSASGKVYKSNAHASYYADKFNGKKTASEIGRAHV